MWPTERLQREAAEEGFGGGGEEEMGGGGATNVGIPAAFGVKTATSGARYQKVWRPRRLGRSGDGDCES